MSDERQGLWVEVEGIAGVEKYFVDEVFELEWNGVAHSYAVLVREEDYDEYSQGNEIVPDVLKYSADAQELVEIEDEDEKTFVVESIQAHYAAEDEAAEPPA